MARFTQFTGWWVHYVMKCVPRVPTSNFDLTLSIFQLAHIQVCLFLLTRVSLVGSTVVNLQKHSTWATDLHFKHCGHVWGSKYVNYKREVITEMVQFHACFNFIWLRNPRVGFWSSGTRLRDLACIGGEGLKSGDFPEYVVSDPFPPPSPIFLNIFRCFFFTLYEFSAVEHHHERDLRLRVVVVLHEEENEERQ